MSPDVVAPSSRALGDLARKYRSLAALRARRDGDGPAASRAELRALASEFPGCLRELDTLGTAELGRRAEACAFASADGPREPWMDWIFGYHTLMRRALTLRQARARTEADVANQDAYARAVLAPPGGRMSVVVLRALAAAFSVPAAAIAEGLFPPRRPRPYRL
jgi:hypothetical protein